MSDPTVYRDGYTRPFRIKAVKGLHGELTGTHRPCVPAERDRMLNVAKKGDPDKTNAAATKLLADRVVGWNATHVDEGGIEQQTPVSAYWIAHMQPTLYDRLYWIVLGQDPGDPIEDGTADEDREYLDKLTGGDAGAIDEGN